MNYMKFEWFEVTDCLPGESGIYWGWFPMYPLLVRYDGCGKFYLANSMHNIPDAEMSIRRWGHFILRYNPLED